MQYAGSNYKTEVVQFKGLNLRPEPADGEYSHAENITTSKFPYLAPIDKRAAADMPATNVSDIFAWDKLVVVAGGKLYIGNDYIMPVTTAPKQFAVVNSKLIIWPDKLQIDLTNMEVLDMGAEFYQDPKPEFTSNTLSISSIPKIDETDGFSYVANSQDDVPWINTYGYDADKIFFDEVNGWTSDGQTPLVPDEKVAVFAERDGAIVIPEVKELEDGRMVYTIIDKWTDATTGPGDISRDLENNLGIFGIIKPSSVHGYNVSVPTNLNIYQAGPYGVRKLEIEAGDFIQISGSQMKQNDQKSIRVSSVKKGTAPEYKDIITFENDPFLVPLHFAGPLDPLPAGTYMTDIWYDRSSDDVWIVKLDQQSRPGSFIFAFSKSFSWRGQQYEVTEEQGDVPLDFFLYDPVEETLTKLGNGFNDVNTGEWPEIGFEDYEGETDALKVGYNIPNLDFICEKDNRLWGVSNATDNEVFNPDTGEYEHFTSRVIYASALGDPTQFFQFNGTDADSWQVAVASKGDFTGIAAYSTSVLAMKENQVLKVFGDYPSNYQMYDYTIPGCAQGAHKSIATIDEVLYYAGRDGVYAYDGSAPRLISYNLGDRQYQNAVGGTDGKRYYLSAENGGQWDLVVYDTVHGIWTREDDANVDDFAYFDGKLYLASNHAVYTTTGGNEPVSWRVVFPALTEGTLKRKRWKWIRLRVYLDEGATMRISYHPYSPAAKKKLESDYDEVIENLKFTRAADLTESGTHMVQIPLAPMRCDHLTIKIEGTGYGEVQALQRAFYAGSEVDWG